MLLFRQLFDTDSSTYTYLLADTESNEAVLIDAVFEQLRRDLALLSELGLKLKYVLDTHCHADHITSAWMLKIRTGAKICISESAGVENADIYLHHGEKVRFGKRFISVRETPGHTDGCLTYVLDNKTMAFTGDCLLIRGCGRTDFQQGEARQMYQSVHTQIFSLPDDTLLYPSHDYRGLTATSVLEEKKFNPRLGGKLSENDFEGLMRNLNLNHPNQIDIALPANLKSGKPDDVISPEDEPKWGKLKYTFAGIWEIDPQELEETYHSIQIIDVRDEKEYHGSLGHIRDAMLLPLDQLSRRTGELDPDKPVVTVCRGGGRSAQATVILNKSGFEKVASLSGGMLRWHAEGHPVVGKID